MKKTNVSQRVYDYLWSLRWEQLQTMTEIADKLWLTRQDVYNWMYYLKKKGLIDESIFNACKDRISTKLEGLKKIQFSDFKNKRLSHSDFIK